MVISCFTSFVAHAAFASLLAGHNYVGIVQSTEDSVAVKKGLADLGIDDNDVDEADNEENASTQQ